MGNKLDTIDKLIVDIEKQMWEIREVMEHTTSINRETPMNQLKDCLLYTSPSPRDRTRSRMPSSA